MNGITCFGFKNFERREIDRTRKKAGLRII